MVAKSSRGRKTEQRILAVAANLINKRGVHGTSVDDVVQASGTGKSQFYHYFGSKEGMIEKLVAFQIERMPAVQNDRLSALNSVLAIEEWLDQVLDDYRSGVYADGCPIGNLASELASSSDSLRQNFEGIFARWEDALTRGLKAIRRQGGLRSGASPEEIATFCVAAIEGSLLLAKTQKRSLPLRSTIAQIKTYLKSQCIGATRRASSPAKRFTHRFCP